MTFPGYPTIPNPPDDGIWTICWSGELFVAVQYQTNICMTSVDGINWLSTSDTWNTITWSDELGIFLITMKST